MGLVELVIAMAILNVVLLALFATFNAGSLALRRASRISTAETIADKQLELYRAHLYSGILLHNGLVAASASDATHTGDSAWVSAASQFTTGTCSPTDAECQPVQTGVTGPDGRSYRIDTYVRALSGADAPPSSRGVKRVTVVVRDSSDGKVLARLTSSFDLATGCKTSTC
jgi:type II secretory pathway pseudopilin PulG